jgi:hypothetical protein
LYINLSLVVERACYFITYQLAEGILLQQVSLQVNFNNFKPFLKFILFNPTTMSLHGGQRDFYPLNIVI